MTSRHTLPALQQCMMLSRERCQESDRGVSAQEVTDFFWGVQVMTDLDENETLDASCLTSHPHLGGIFCCKSQ